MPKHVAVSRWVHPQSRFDLIRQITSAFACGSRAGLDPTFGLPPPTSSDIAMAVYPSMPLASAISAFTVACQALPLIVFLMIAGASAVAASPRPPLVNASISFNVSAFIATCHATPSVQIVSHHLLQVHRRVHGHSIFLSPSHILQPSSPDIAAAAWAASAELHAQNARYAAWFPYQRLGVAELDPPSDSYLCVTLLLLLLNHIVTLLFPCSCGPSAWAVGSGGGSIGQMRPVELTCSGSFIASIDFASYGQPTGTCGSYSLGSCHAASSLAVVQTLCLNRSSCSIPLTSFGPPPCVHSYLAVQVCIRLRVPTREISDV